ncbi:hypothetical protein [Catenuloplanes indicus]|uniref:Uncharacterized protein n=1 Tax=Catenuloplanes indicus TaxID=137267 RepID=A0AAE4AXQ0_9ACTN|nr:hypothetical protein [Catenuloplanes indicus]MDQ0366452.1 hypothetical protein [Catenuloplanes indicus]
MTDRVESRAASLLPEERRVGSDDVEAQAEEILLESDERTADTTAAPDSFVEHRTSVEAAGAGQEPPD